MKRRFVIMLATATLAVTPVVFGESRVAEINPATTVPATPRIYSAAEVLLLRFDKPISNVESKLAEFTKKQVSGARFTAEDAANFFSDHDKVVVQLHEVMALMASGSGSLGAYERQGIPVKTEKIEGGVQTTTLQSVMVETGARASVSLSEFDSARRAEVTMKIDQAVLGSGTQTIPYTGSTAALMQGGEVLPLLWKNNGKQYGAFLALQVSQNK